MYEVYGRHRKTYNVGGCTWLKAFFVWQRHGLRVAYGRESLGSRYIARGA